jgi:transposase
MKKTDFIGIDISKDTIDCALVNIDKPGSFKEKKFKNEIEGFEELEQWLLKHKVDLKNSLFCMEHTGTYGLLLFAWLSQKEVDYCVEPGLQIKRSLGMTRGKDDKIDARRIADYARTHNAKLKLFSFPSEQILQIKQLLTFREQMVRIRTSLKNSIKSHEKYERITRKHYVTNEIDTQIKYYDKIIKENEKEILDLIESDQELKKNFDLATSVKGIGVVIAAFMLVTTNNFSSFADGRKYACYAGVAPFENSSRIIHKGKNGS